MFWSHVYFVLIDPIFGSGSKHSNPAFWGVSHEKWRYRVASTPAEGFITETDGPLSESFHLLRSDSLFLLVSVSLSVLGSLSETFWGSFKSHTQSAMEPRCSETTKQMWSWWAESRLKENTEELWIWSGEQSDTLSLWRLNDWLAGRGRGREDKKGESFMLPIDNGPVVGSAFIF